MTLFPPNLLEAAQEVAARLTAQRLTLTTAESCTGGLLSALLTEIPGSSAFFTHGFITYANEAKTAMLGVDPTLIQLHGAVSEPVARAMAEGALRASHSALAVAITGIAGPGGGTAQKPVGTVHIALTQRDGATTHHAHHFTGNRTEVRLAALRAALAMITNARC